MQEPLHSLASLFQQLGLPSEPVEIRLFIESNCPLPEHVLLHEAPFWNQSQSVFLLENVQNDADWSVVIDQLNVALRQAKD